MTGYESKRAAARDKLEDDDTQVYQTELTKLLMEGYDRGVADALEETKKALAHPAQEHVAVQHHDDTLTIAYQSGFYDGKKAAQRPWVGLTDDHITEVIDSMPQGINGWMSDWDLYEYANALLARTKEKNNAML